MSKNVNPELFYVEYRERDGDWRLHSIVTADFSRHRISQTQYDVDWCKRDECLYAHESGGSSGVEVHIHRFCNAPKICGKVWIHPAATLVHYVKVGEKWETQPLPRVDMAAMGYLLLDTPLSDDPLADCRQDEETRYCRICDDYLPSSYEEGLCGHLFFMDSGEYGGCGSSNLKDNDVRKLLRAVFATLNEVELVTLRKALIDRHYKARVHGFMFGSDWLEFEIGGPGQYMDIGPKLTEHARGIRDGGMVDGGWMDGINWLRSLDKADGCREYEAFAADCIVQYLAEMTGFSVIAET